MARRPEGWKIRRAPGNEIYSVRFSWGGRQHEPSTGERDPERAAEAAARIYAEYVRGGGPRKRPRIALGQYRFDEVAASWLADVESTLDPDTVELYGLHVRAHLAPFFVTLDQISNRDKCEDYSLARLKRVQSMTVRKELTTLRGLAAWAFKKRYLPEMPNIPGVPVRVTGKRHKQGRKGPRPPLSPAEVRKLLAAFPARSRGGWPIRARFVVAYETSLRPSTLDALSVPENYHKGSKQIRVWFEDDKGRYERSVPLSREARKALDAVCPDAGPIFGKHDYRPHIERAVKKLPPEKAAVFTGQHLRGARITHWLEETGNLPGAQYLAGHKRSSTTDKYAQATLRAAEAVIQRRRRR
jgi:integrase